MARMVERSVRVSRSNPNWSPLSRTRNNAWIMTVLSKGTLLFQRVNVFVELEGFPEQVFVAISRSNMLAWRCILRGKINRDYYLAPSTAKAAPPRGRISSESESDCIMHPTRRTRTLPLHAPSPFPICELTPRRLKPVLTHAQQ